MTTSVLNGAEIDSWYRRYVPQLRFAARRIVGNAADAEDAIQETFVAVLRARDRYDGRDPFPWLYRIATRKALTIAASRRAVPMPLEGLVPREPSAEDAALARSWSDQLHAIVRSEPAVALHLIDGLRFREVGAWYGTPTATAATRIRRGKRRLLGRLKATLTELPESKPA